LAPRDGRLGRYQLDPPLAAGSGTSRTTGCSKLRMTCPEGVGVTLIVIAEASQVQGWTP
jgi:hypothetical protein